MVPFSLDRMHQVEGLYPAVSYSEGRPAASGQGDEGVRRQGVGCVGQRRVLPRSRHRRSHAHTPPTARIHACQATRRRCGAAALRPPSRLPAPCSPGMGAHMEGAPRRYERLTIISKKASCAGEQGEGEGGRRVGKEAECGLSNRSPPPRTFSPSLPSPFPLSRLTFPFIPPHTQVAFQSLTPSPVACIACGTHRGMETAVGRSADPARRPGSHTSAIQNAGQSATHHHLRRGHVDVVVALQGEDGGDERVGGGRAASSRP